MPAIKSDVYRAIADPTRRVILDLLSVSERSVKELTASFPMTQQAVSQHLSELHAARLVTSRRVHRENRYRLTRIDDRPGRGCSQPAIAGQARKGPIPWIAAKTAASSHHRIAKKAGLRNK